MPFSPESQLRRTENILASISDCFFALDATWHFVYLNPQAQAFFGRPKEQLLGYSVWEALPEVGGTLLERELRHLREGGGRAHFEFQQPQDGRWIDYTLYARDTDAEFVEAGGGISVYFRDVTQSRQNAQERREREEFYRLLVENAREYGIIALDVDGCVTHWNEGARCIFGWSEDEVRGQKGNFIFMPQDREDGVPELEIETARREGRAPDERWHLKKDGSRFWAEGAMMALGFEEGRVRGFVKVLHDNTEKRAAQDAVLQNEERLKQVSDATGIALWAWEPKRDIIHYQHALDSLYGFPVESFAAVSSHIHPDDLPALNRELSSVLETGRTAQLLFRISAKPEEVPWKWIQSIVSFDQTQGDQPLFLGINSDVTEQLLAQGALRDSKERLESVVHETHVALWSWNPRSDELIEELNLETVTGVSPFSMDKMRQAIHPDDWPRVQSVVEGALARGEGYEIEHRIARVPNPDPRRPADWKWLAAKAGVSSVGVSSAGDSSQGDSSQGDSSQGDDTVFSGFVFDVSARRENELALAQSRERLQSVVIETGIALWLWDPNSDRIIEQVNLDEIFEISGVNLQATLAAMHPDDAPQVTATLQQAIAFQRPYEVEFRLRRRAGNGDPRVAADWKWVLITGKPGFDGDGYLLMSGFAFDVSSRKEAELLRRTSEERYTALVGASTTMVWRTSPAGQFLDSTGWNQYTGQTLEQSAGFGWFDAICEGDRARVQREWAESVSQRLPLVELRYRLCHHSGQVRHVLVRGVPILDAQGELVEWLGTLEDVHDQIEAQNAVRESEARYAALVRASATVVWRASADVVDVETVGWRDYTGATHEQMDDFSWLEFIHPDDRDRVRAEWRDLLAAPRPLEFRQRLLHHAGQYRHVLVRAVPLFEEGEGNRVREWIGTVTDVHERVLAEELRELYLKEEQRARQLAEDARAQAERANQMKDDFLAVVSHELRTPLNAILGWSNILQSGELSPEIAREGLAVIERNARVQTQIVEDILDVARIVTGKLKVESFPLDLETVAFEALEATQAAATARGVVLNSQLVSLPVEGDAVRLRQVMWNLLSNAIKFSSPGAHVHLTLSRFGERARIEVRDEGAGIAPEFLPHVFERFRQADSSSTRRHGGLGLGLALVRSIVEAHGGHVEAKSEGKGKGATFIVELPLSAHTRQAPAEVAPKLEGRLIGLSLLVCDDALDTLEFTAFLLRREGARVSIALSPEEAQEKLKSDSFDVLLSDLAMPDQDGYELLKWVQTHVPGLPVVAMTAYAGTAESDRARDAGFAGFVSKPIDNEALIETVAGVLLTG